MPLGPGSGRGHEATRGEEEVGLYEGEGRGAGRPGGARSCNRMVAASARIDRWMQKQFRISWTAGGHEGDTELPSALTVTR